MFSDFHRFLRAYVNASESFYLFLRGKKWIGGEIPPSFPREIIECPLSRRGRTEDSFWISICPYQLPPVIRTNRFTTRIVRCFGIEMINDSVYDFKLNVSRNVLRYDVKKTTFSPKSFVTRYTSPRTVAISCATCHPSPNRPHLPSPRFEQQS